MTAIAQTLDQRLKSWRPETAAKVEKLVNDIIAAADADSLDLLRSRAAEQDVLNLLDEPASR